MSEVVRPRLPCTVVLAADMLPTVARGQVVHGVDGQLHLSLEGSGAGLVPGVNIVIEYVLDGRTERAVAHIEQRDGNELAAQVRRVAPDDQREYPRVEGTLSVRYHVAESLEEAGRWLQGQEPTSRAFVPDPFMNLSVTGLQFEDEQNCAEGDILLVAFAVPGGAVIWRCAATVVRVAPIPAEQRDPDIQATHQIAVSFVRIPQEAAEALLQYTVQLQDDSLSELESSP